MSTYSIYEKNDKTFIQAVRKATDDLGFKTSELGFIEVEADKAESIMQKLNSNEIALDFDVRATNGLWQLKVVRVVAPETVASATLEV